MIIKKCDKCGEIYDRAELDLCDNCNCKISDNKNSKSIEENHPQKVVVTKYMYGYIYKCPQCGSSIESKEYKYCPYCGTYLEWD